MVLVNPIKWWNVVSKCYARLGLFTLQFSWSIVGLLTYDRVGLLGESRGSSVGKGRESDVSSRDLQGGNPHLCRVRSDVLTLTSKY
jgi:hypothetical protein